MWLRVCDSVCVSLLRVNRSSFRPIVSSLNPHKVNLLPVYSFLQCLSGNRHDWLACLVFKEKKLGVFFAAENVRLCCFFLSCLLSLFFFFLRAMRCLLARQAIMDIKELVYNPNWLKSELDIDLYTSQRLFSSSSSSYFGHWQGQHVCHCAWRKKKSQSMNIRNNIYFLQEQHADRRRNSSPR